MDKPKYLKNPQNCFYCGSDELATGEGKFDGIEYEQEIQCLGCLKMWVDIYKLSGVRELEPPMSNGEINALHAMYDE